MMEMSLRKSLLLLTVAAVMVISAEEVILKEEKGNQTRKVKVPLGSTLTFYCGLKKRHQNGFWVSWFFNPDGPSFNETKHKICTEFFNKSRNNSTEVCSKTKQNFGDDTEETWPNFSLVTVTQNNSGWYFCRIKTQIPILIVNISQGIKVVTGTQSLFHSVTMKTITEHTTYPSPVSPSLLDEWWMWILLAAIGLVLIVLLVLISLCVTRRLRESGEEGPVYGNMHQRSPKPGTPAADKLKMVSSSQNLRNPSPSRTYDEGKRRQKR